MGGGRGPKAQAVVLSAEDRRKLERVEAAATAAQRDALRARIVLRAAEAVPNERIAGELGITPNTVRKWRGPFAPARGAGLGDRPRPGRRPRPGQPGRREFEYIRHGTVTLIAALNVHTGAVLGRCGPQRTAADLLAFLEDVAAAYPTGAVHVVWDNLNIHRGARWADFNRVHGERFQFHFTPLHASWVNQVECWLSLLARRVVRPGSLRCTDDM